MIELNQLEKLVTIAKMGTISKAAEELLISQPALTRSIQNLEKELDVKLFERKKNKVILNGNGKLAVEYAKKILADANEMVTQIQYFDRSHRQIVLGSCAPAPIWGLTSYFNDTQPQITMTSNLENDEATLISGLKKHQYSLIVVTSPQKIIDYCCIHLFDENLYISVPPAHPLALFKEASFQDLDGESILLLSKIGFWNEICIENLPHSHLLTQEDMTVFNEILKASALPNFRSNITLQQEHDQNRINILLTDDCAKVSYYAVFHKQYSQLFSPLKEVFSDFDWSRV